MRGSLVHAGLAALVALAAAPTAGAQPSGSCHGESCGPPCPTGVAGYVTEGGSVFVGWTLNSFTDVVLYRAQGDASFEAIQRLEFPATRAIDHDVQPGTTYRYQVRAVDAEGRESEACGTFEVTTVPDLAGAGMVAAAGLGVGAYALARRRR